MLVFLSARFTSIVNFSGYSADLHWPTAEKKCMDWCVEIACEGGPVLVANSDDFREWTGSEPFPSSRRKQLLFYSPFTRELPEEFRKYGDTGHVVVETSDPAGLRDRLIAACMESFPGSTVDRTGGSWVLTRSDGKKLHAYLEPSSEYALATRTLKEDGLHAFGNARSCFLWSAEPGVVLVQVSRDHSMLMLAQVNYANSDQDVADAYAHASTTPPTNDSGVRYEVVQGPVVAIWSPQSAADLQTGFNIDNSSPGNPGVALDLVTSKSGAAVWLRPGRYAARTAYSNAASWGVSWCLLTPVSDQFAAVESQPAAQSAKN